MKTLLVSFVYPLIETYLSDFFKSLNNQTVNCYDTIIFKDGFYNDLKQYNYFGKTMSNINNLNIIQVRKHIIDYSINNNYDLLIFIDADDVMANNRVEKIIENFNEDFSFYYNDLFLLSRKGKDFYDGQLPETVNNISLIEKYNFIGMSHTALNLRKEKNLLLKMPICSDIIAFDWYLHSYILLNGGKGKKVDTKTYYRIYENNIAGNPNNINKEKLLKGLKVKKTHYKSMAKLDSKFNDYYIKLIKLENFINKEMNLNNYLDYLNNHHKEFNYWWEYVLMLDEINLNKF